ncbi:MAG: CDP-diacylglycerol--glycerol-3-phosphate 3-phosphatidyltransferase [Candidatus Omnitrophica bacterium]|nr:CDP-diacylglycerol--glycerol-3-phosphate 3-phosphatidyltransferase [Candidatus Omnitrophota bacterium]
MNLPNVLTLSRIFFAGVLVFLLEGRSSTGNILAVIVFAIASFTDFYDGHLAKKRGLVSDFGKIMDPVADKILLLSVFGVLAHIARIEWWMFIVIAIREILVTLSRLWAMRHGQVIAAERAGKIKTVVQIIAVSSILLYLAAQQSDYYSSWFYNFQSIWLGVNHALMLVAVILTIYSGIEYFRNKSKIGVVK